MGREVHRGERVRPGPKSGVAVLVLLWRHRGALEYDLRSRFGWGADRIVNGACPWNLAVMLVGQILLDPYSHSTAALRGWAFVPNPVDVMFADWVDATAQMHHQKGKVRPQPVKRPWEQQQRVRDLRSPAEREAQRAKLRERLGLN